MEGIKLLRCEELRQSRVCMKTTRHKFESMANCQICSLLNVKQHKSARCLHCYSMLFKFDEDQAGIIAGYFGGDIK